MSPAVARGTALIDDAAQGLEQRGRPVDLVDDDELADLCAEKRISVCEATLIRGAFQVEVCRAGLSLCCELASEGGLTDLARPEQDDARHVLEPSFDQPFDTSGNGDHHRKSNV